jgi:cephalosporin hydroxylase
MNAFETATVDRAVRAGYARGMYQHLEEINALGRLLCRHDVRRVLEIGMHRGGTAAMFAELAPDLVVSVDKHDGEWGGIGEASANDRDAGLARDYPHWRVVRGDSHDPATLAAVRDLMEGIPFDFLFIDGDHSHAGVRADFLDYRGLVRPGGLIGFHDVADTAEHRRVGCEVDRLWAELRAGKHGFYACEDLTVPGLPWGGIGVVHA